MFGGNFAKDCLEPRKEWNTGQASRQVYDSHKQTLDAKS